MPVIQGITMSQAKAESFVNAAIQAAEDNGYCQDSAVEVLESLGFPVGSTEAEVLIRVRLVDLPRNFNVRDIDTYNVEVQFGDGIGPHGYVDEVVSITKA